MNPEDVVEVFVGTIIIGVMLVVTITVLNPNLGQILIGILPKFIESMIYLLIFGIVIALLYQLFD